MLRRSLAFSAVVVVALLASSLVVARQSPAEAPIVKRTYVTQRLAGEPPTIDGRLDDACWQQGEWAGDYLQREPFQGAAPSLPTKLKILYDNRNLYIAIRATDPGIAREPRLLGQRDEFSGDMVGVAFDSYFNRRTAFEFDVTSGGSKIDLVLRNDGSVDTNWNAIWDVKVATDAGGWTAEYRIPLSQLRYSGVRQQVWGLHAWRWIRGKQEESDWQLIPMDNTGFVLGFGELQGIEDLPPSRRIELMPYTVAKYRTPAEDADNPFRHGAATTLSAGLDAKIGLGSDFTLDWTVNPDFGQVEADPSEINLGTTETFHSEHRPFFVEGKAMFDYGIDGDRPFYSRRLGAAPANIPDEASFTTAPQTTRILTAEKITGRTSGGFSLGLLHGVTERTPAVAVDDTGHRWDLVAQPLTNYVVTRAQNEFNGGDTLVGAIVTGVQRAGSDADLNLLTRQALTAGGDVLHYWNERTYYIDARALFTRVSGPATAINELQTDLVHNFQRPDADHVDVDPDATSLSGNAGFLRAGKGYGVWRYFGDVSWRSPGVEFNDVGYLASADFVMPSAQVQFFDTEPGRFFRRRDFRLHVYEKLDYGGDLRDRGMSFNASVAGLNNWGSWSGLSVHAPRLDTRGLRGGPALRAPSYADVYVYAETDGSRPTQATVDAGYALDAEGSRYWRIGPGVGRRFGDRIRVSAGVSYEHNQQVTQYVDDTTIGVAPGYVVGAMEQQTLASEFRVQANFSPTLSLAYYGGPFASTGRYDDFRLVAHSRAVDPAERFATIDATRAGGGYLATTGGSSFYFDNPDFAWRELNSNLVLKWEFRPGSTFYAVWSQHRTDDRDFGDFTDGGEYRRLFSAHPDNTFLLKVSYWFSI